MILMLILDNVIRNSRLYSCLVHHTSLKSLRPQTYHSTVVEGGRIAVLITSTPYTT